MGAVAERRKPQRGERALPPAGVRITMATLSVAEAEAVRVVAEAAEAVVAASHPHRILRKIACRPRSLPRNWNRIDSS